MEETIREPGPLTPTEALGAVQQPDDRHLRIWSSLEPVTRDAAFYATIFRLRGAELSLPPGVREVDAAELALEELMAV